MGIDVVVESESGEVLGKMLDPGNRLVRALNLPGLEATACLRFIDPYGDTIFNRLQIPHLVAELQALRANVNDALVQHLEGVLELIRGVHEPHLYVRFRGD
jgi:hypothetical protein